MKKISKKIIITGNHHTPAIELIKQLKDDPDFHWQIDYISHSFSSETHIKNSIIPLVGKHYFNLESGKFDRRWLINTLIGIPKTLSAIIKSIKIIKKIKPDIVVSFGGYTSVPVIFSAAILNIPSITHEQTLTPSLATRINSYFTKKIALSFGQTSKYFPKNSSKISITGNLLRSDIFKINSPKYQHLETIIKNKPLIYITGGSQGAHSINQVVANLIPKLENYTIIHQTGKLDFSHLSKSLVKKYQNYHPAIYINSQDIGWILNHCSLIISRAGANTCQEILILNKTSILIPLPFSQQSEQDLNAALVKEKLPTQTSIISDQNLSPQTLLSEINKLTAHPYIQKNTPIKSIQNTKLLKLIHEIV